MSIYFALCFTLLRNRRYESEISAHAILMYLGEMALLITSALVMTGLANGVTRRLHLNDFVASFLIFVIVILNVRGGVKVGGRYSLALGGLLSVLVSIYMMIARRERSGDIFFAVLSMLGNAGIVFLYTLHFFGASYLDPRALSALLSILAGLWCALAARRTFASCLFAAITGGFLGTTIHLIFFRNSGNIGGSYSFSTMWLTAIFGLTIQYLLSLLVRSVKIPRTDIYFEAGELMDENDEEDKDH